MNKYEKINDEILKKIEQGKRVPLLKILFQEKCPKNKKKHLKRQERNDI